MVMNLLNVVSTLYRIESLVRKLLKGQEKIMQGEDDLKAALTANATAIQQVTTEINDKVTALVAAAKGDSDDDIEVLAQQLTTQTAQLNLAVSNAVNPVPAPAPSTGGAATVTDTQAATAAPAKS